MATRAQIEQALINADKSGALDDAKALSNALLSNQFDDAKINPYSLPKSPSQDAKPSNAVDFTQSNQALTDSQKIRESGAMDSPFGKMLDASPAGGVLDAASSIASSAIAEPIAGIAGLAGLPFGADRAAKNVEDVRNLIARQPRTTIGKAIVGGIGAAAQSVGDALGNPLEKSKKFLGDAAYDVGGPAAGAVASAIPDAAMMALGGVAGKVLPGAGAKVLGKASERYGNAGDSLLAEAKAIQSQVKAGKFQINPDEPALKQVANILINNDPAEIAAMLKSDPGFQKAVEALGIKQTAPASFSSDNPAYRGIEQGLAAQAANPLGILSDDFIKGVQDKAGELITKYKGSQDKAGVDEKFLADSQNSIDKLNAIEEKGYGKMRDNISGDTVAGTENIMAHIESVLKTRNNEIKNLPPFLRKIYVSLKPKVKTTQEPVFNKLGVQVKGAEVKQSIPPTLDILEDLRKDVGRAFRRKEGPYADENSHMLGEAYAALRADADSVYEKAGMIDELKKLNKTTVLRKELEKNNIDLLGKQLAKSITFKVGAAIKGVTGSGGVETFTQLMNKIKNNNSRQQIMVTAINHLIKGSSEGKGNLDIPKFVARMDELNKQPTAKKVIAKELPKGMMADLDNLHYIARRISLAQKSRIPTGVSAALFNQDAGLLSRLGGPTAKAVLGGARMVGFGKVADAAMVVKSFVKDGKVSRGEAVTKMLASPDFQSLVINSLKNKNVVSKEALQKINQAEKKFEKSTVYKQWAATLDASEIKALQAAGLTAYLFTQPTVIPITEAKGQ